MIIVESPYGEGWAERRSYYVVLDLVPFFEITQMDRTLSYFYICIDVSANGRTENHPKGKKTIKGK